MAAKQTATATTTTTTTKAPTKGQMLSYISDKTGLTRKEVGLVFDSLSELIKKNLGKRGPGVFALPGLLKMSVIRKPATSEREGINPFTGEKTIFKAKPARRVVKVRALKGLREMV